jgi:CubicO group peptidase (beta-lactamase class C family)
VEYSSPAYYLLATILEKQYHKSYDALLQEQILGPLHMQQTGVYDQTAIISKMVSGYNLVGDTGLIVAPYRDVSAMGGGGNMYATATDLLHWCRSFLSGKWDSSIVQTTFSPSTAQPISHKGGSLYGMGWYLREKTDQQPKAYHIGGGTFGFSSKIAIYPEENFCIIILANVSFLPLDDVLWKDIEAMAFGKPFKMPMQSAVQVNLPVGELEKFTGSYASTNGMELNIFVQEKSLYVKLGRNPPLAIYAKSPYEFFARKIDIQFVFTFSKEGKVTALKSNGRGRTDHFTKR